VNVSVRHLAVAAIAVLTVAMSACGGDAVTDTRVLSGFQLTPAPSVADLSMPDASAGDTDFAFVAPAGQLLLVYFGYTSCPDVCPTSLSDVKHALATLDDRASSIEVAMVTIDPDRDGAELLTNYVRSFVPTAHALRTDDADLLASVAAGFGASYSVETNDAGEIEVGHSASIYVVDDSGSVVLTWPFGLPDDAMSTDLSILLDQMEAAS
jgi:protein SCO1/2